MNAEFWVAAGFVVFIGAALYFGAHSKVGGMLDTRGKRIRDELDEAERLRQEAADVLASFEQRRQDAEREANEIVEQARSEAELIAKDAEERMADFVKRRTAQAEAKISNAETQALAQVRASAADAATAAADVVLRQQPKKGFADKLIDESIGDVKRLAH